MFVVRQGRDAIEASPVFDDIWKIYAELGVHERHFNNLQARYRALASTRLLAAFAGIGFVVSKKDISVLGSPLYVAAVIAMAGAIGITLLWNLDQMVYFTLLESVFREGLLIERQHKWLPPIRNNMLVLSRDQGVRRRTACFYISGVGILLLIGVGAVVIQMAGETWWAVLPAASGVVLSANWMAYMWRSNLQRDWRSYAISCEVLINYPVEVVFRYLAEPDLVIKWAGLNLRVPKEPGVKIKELTPKVEGPPSEGSVYEVGLGAREDKSADSLEAPPSEEVQPGVREDKGADSSGEGGSLREIEMHDSPYGLTVRFSIPNRNVRRFYRLSTVSNGTKLSVAEYRYSTTLRYRFFLLLREPFWVFVFPFLWRFQVARRRVLEDDVRNLAKIIASDTSNKKDLQKEQEKQRQHQLKEIQRKVKGE